MAIPALPSDTSAGNTWSAAEVNAIYDHLQYHRDTKPTFKGIAVGASGFTMSSASADIANDTTTTLGFGIGGSFAATPTINIGSWAVNAADADPESVETPEAGMYLLVASTDWESDSTGRRYTSIKRDGSSTPGSTAQVAAVGQTRYTVAMLADIASGVDLDVDVYQNSGGNLEVTVYLAAYWLVST